MIWLPSSFHCNNIFGTDYNYAGVAGVGNKWTQVFTQLSATVSNPLFDGAHWVDATLTGGQLRFLVSFSLSSGAPQAINVTVDSTAYPMTLHLGTASRGTYSVDLPSSVASLGCVAYFFQATTTTGATWRLPEGTESYLTAEQGTCTSNYVEQGTTAPSSAPTDTTSPSLAPTAAPSLSPTSAPTQVMVREALFFACLFAKRGAGRHVESPLGLLRDHLSSRSQTG
jgi:hypothetical protein